MDEGAIVVLLLWVTIYSMAFALCIVMLWSQRERQPVKFRGARLTIVSAVGGFLLTVTHCAWFFRHVDGFVLEAYCEVESWMWWTSYPVFILPYFLRAFRHIYIQRSIARALDQGAGPGAGAAQAGAGGYGEMVLWEQNSAPRLTESKLLWILARFLLLFVVVKVVVDAGILVSGTKGGFGERTDGFCKLGFARAVMYISIHLVEFVSLLTVLCWLRGGWMGARVFRKSEYGIFLMVWGGSTAAICIASALVFDDYIPYPAYSDIILSILIVRNTFTFLVSQLWIVVLSFDSALSRRHAQPTIDCAALTSLDSVLADMTCMQLFREYLIDTSRVEMLLCWMEIEILRDAHPGQRSLHAGRLWDKYLASDAPLAVKVSAEVREAVSKQILDPESGVQSFDEIQDELFSQMQSVFVSFLASRQGRECHRRLAHHELLYTAYMLSGMVRPSTESALL